MPATAPSAPADLIGRTVHLLNGTRYAGAWTVTWVITEADAPVDAWFRIFADRRMWSSRMADVFASEAEARAEARSRRAPRRSRQPEPLYGDYAQLAAFHGIRTDGTGRRA
jgi:hypothetical protein